MKVLPISSVPCLGILDAREDHERLSLHRCTVWKVYSDTIPLETAFVLDIGLSIELYHEVYLFSAQI